MTTHENIISVPIPDDLRYLFREFPEYLPMFQDDLNQMAIDFPVNIPDTDTKKFMTLRGELTALLLKHQEKIKKDIDNYPVDPTNYFYPFKMKKKRQSLGGWEWYCDYGDAFRILDYLIAIGK